MNLLAHALLSGPDVELRLGNVLADFVKGRERRTLPPGVQRGVKLHQRIDAFTDLHPIVARSKARIDGFPYVAGILVDVFYDHFLALRWGDHAHGSLDAFVAELYGGFRAYPAALPPTARSVLGPMMEQDWLGSYRSVAGIDQTLRRIGRRLLLRTGRDLGFDRAVTALHAHFDALDADFSEFFPLLRKHASARD